MPWFLFVFIFFLLGQKWLKWIYFFIKLTLVYKTKIVVVFLKKNRIFYSPIWLIDWLIVVQECFRTFVLRPKWKKDFYVLCVMHFFHFILILFKFVISNAIRSVSIEWLSLFVIVFNESLWYSFFCRNCNENTIFFHWKRRKTNLENRQNALMMFIF